MVEGTAGNTGIGLAHICKSLGYQCVIYMPDTQSQVHVHAHTCTRVCLCLKGSATIHTAYHLISPHFNQDGTSS